MLKSIGKFSLITTIFLSTSLYSLPTHISAESNNQGPIPINSKYPGETVFQGENPSNDSVKQLEWLLYEAGYLKKRDGIFKKDEDGKAVETFQRSENMIDKEVIGVPGEVTWKKLVSISNGEYPTENSYVKWQSQIPIRRLEALLVHTKFLDKEFADGRISKEDIEACKKFQIQSGKWNKNTAWGVPGPVTWNLLIQDYMKDHTLPKFEEGKKEPAVNNLRTFLKLAGYPTTSTGDTFTPEDREIVKKFQLAQGYSEYQATGIPDQTNWQSLQIGSLGLDEEFSAEKSPQPNPSNQDTPNETTASNDPYTVKTEQLKVEQPKQKEEKKSDKKSDQEKPKKDLPNPKKSAQAYCSAKFGDRLDKAYSMTASAYGKGVVENGPWGNVDSLGNPLKQGTIAVDKNLIPLGTKVHVAGYDNMGIKEKYLPKKNFDGKATDVGGAITGKRIDIFVPLSANGVSPFGMQEKVAVCTLKK
ncbi:3D domain-containing protein [Seinonella peptonophila]|uniref:3D domain-containing protein n=1 Tax=Seinonella peptonophila TaxID=112248 RepID=UPI00093532EF|nr:3D domain-containing protein [Seinonella peptonophila]